MRSALKFKQLGLPKQTSEIARLKVVAGPDYGCVFVITGAKVTIGRGEDNDAVLSDLKASRKHAELSLAGRQWTVKDAGSANGILHNNRPTRSTSIRTLDTITLGETTLEFVSADAGADVIVSDPKSVEQIKSEQSAFEAQKKKVRNLGVIGGVAKATAGAAQKNGAAAGPRMLLIGVGGIAAYLFLNSGTPAPAPAKRAPTSITVVSTSANELQGGPLTMDPSVARTSEQLFKSGFREYGQGNYIRAKQLFETVLQIAPGHKLALLYLENCTNAIETEVKLHLELGRKDVESGKLKEAKGHFEAVMRLKFRDPSSPHYVEAKDQLEKVTKEMQHDDSGGTG